MLNDSNHPIWALARVIIINITLLLVLWLTAHQFDGTEIKTIIIMFLASAGVETLPMFTKKTNTTPK